MFWGLSSTFSEHYQPRALVLKLHEPPTPFYTWVSMHTHAAFSYQFSHVWTINVDALISNPYYVCTSNLQRNPKNQKKKKPQCHSQSLVCCFFYFFNFNLSLIIQFFKLFNILHAWKCLSVFSSSFFVFYQKSQIKNREAWGQRRAEWTWLSAPHLHYLCTHSTCPGPCWGHWMTNGFSNALIKPSSHMINNQEE